MLLVLFLTHAVHFLPHRYSLLIMLFSCSLWPYQPFFFTVNRSGAISKQKKKPANHCSSKSRQEGPDEKSISDWKEPWYSPRRTVQVQGRGKQCQKKVVPELPAEGMKMPVNFGTVPPTMPPTNPQKVPDNSPQQFLWQFPQHLNNSSDDSPSWQVFLTFF